MRTIGLTKFCSTDETRVPLMKPWREGDFTYASDGRVIIRVPAEPGDAVNARAPSAESLFAWGNLINSWQKLPTLPDVELEECDWCDGDKVHECECGNQHKCPNCEGSGKVSKDGHLNIGPARFNCYYLRLIADLPNLEIAIYGELEPMAFRFDGGVGVLMPMRKGSE